MHRAVLVLVAAPGDASLLRQGGPCAGRAGGQQRRVGNGDAAPKRWRSDHVGPAAGLEVPGAHTLLTPVEGLVAPASAACHTRRGGST